MELAINIDYRRGRRGSGHAADAAERCTADAFEEKKPPEILLIS